MSLRTKTLIFLFVLACVACLTATFLVKAKISKYQAEIEQLQNQAAAQAKTIEVQKGVYEKLSQTNGDLSSLLSQKDQQLKELSDQLKQKDQQLLSVTQASVMWKHAYEATVAATQTTVPTQNQPGQPNVERKKVEFSKDFGMIGVQGYTLTDPPEAYVKVQQNIPLRLTIALTQNPDKTWSTYVTSSDSNTAVTVDVSAVNPYLLRPKWYEKIGLYGGASLGVDGGQVGLLGSLGVSYQISKFEAGPKLDLLLTDRVEKFYGVGLTWHPFARAE